MKWNNIKNTLMYPLRMWYIMIIFAISAYFLGFIYAGFIVFILILTRMTYNLYKGRAMIKLAIKVLQITMFGLPSEAMTPEQRKEAKKQFNKRCWKDIKNFMSLAWLNPYSEKGKLIRQKFLAELKYVRLLMKLKK